MQAVHECLILAAGNGSRIMSASGGSPKPLVQLHGKSLLEHVILDAREAGIDRFVIVVGYGADAMRRWLVDRQPGGVSITLVENAHYYKDNGVSVLKAKDELRNAFMLLMADQIFESRTAKALLEQPLIPGEVILAVDPKIDQVFDLDDATKVRRKGDCIVDIGKKLTRYDAFDTGMFPVQPGALRRSRIGKDGGKLLVVRRNAHSGTSRQAARVRYPRRRLAGRGHAGGLDLRREHLSPAFFPHACKARQCLNPLPKCKGGFVVSQLSSELRC
jgi:choline kinase